MAHQRTITKNRYFPPIINKGKKIHMLNAYTDENRRDEPQKGLGADV